MAMMTPYFFFVMVVLSVVLTSNGQKCDPCDLCGTFLPEQLYDTDGMTCQEHLDHNYPHLLLDMMSPIKDEDCRLMMTETNFCLSGCCDDTIPPKTPYDDDLYSSCTVEANQADSCFAKHPECSVCNENYPMLEDKENDVSTIFTQLCEHYASCCPPCEYKFNEFITCFSSTLGFVHVCPLVGPTTTSPSVSPSMVPTSVLPQSSLTVSNNNEVSIPSQCVLLATEASMCLTENMEICRTSCAKTKDGRLDHGQGCQNAYSCCPVCEEKYKLFYHCVASERGGVKTNCTGSSTTNNGRGSSTSGGVDLNHSFVTGMFAFVVSMLLLFSSWRN